MLNINANLLKSRPIVHLFPGWGLNRLYPLVRTNECNVDYFKFLGDFGFGNLLDPIWRSLNQ